MLKALFILDRSLFTVSNHLWRGLPRGLFPIGFSTTTFLIRHPSVLYTCPAHFIHLCYELIYIFLDYYKMIIIRHSFFFQISPSSYYILAHIFFSKFSSQNLKISSFPFVAARVLHEYVCLRCHAHVAMGRKYVVYNIFFVRRDKSFD